MYTALVHFFAIDFYFNMATNTVNSDTFISWKRYAGYLCEIKTEPGVD